MTNIRRYYDTNDIVFTTHVTFNRLPILIKSANIILKALTKTFDDNLIAWVVLPDHLHLLSINKENDLTDLIKKMKLSFSANYRKIHNMKSGRLWQNRFYDHIIRNQEDLNHHFDYIHYNPVKHGLINKPKDWEFSSIRDYEEFYGGGWGVNEEIVFKEEYGE